MGNQNESNYDANQIQILESLHGSVMVSRMYLCV